MELQCCLYDFDSLPNKRVGTTVGGCVTIILRQLERLRDGPIEILI